MNKNSLKHKFLSILSNPFIEGWGTKEPSGLTEIEIKNSLKINDFQLKVLVTDLSENKEIISYAPNGEKGWMATSKGVTSFNNKKYVKLRNKNTWDLTKNWVQTVIPVLSLVITILVILNKDNAINEDITELKERIQYIEQQEKGTKSLIHKDILSAQKTKNDTVIIK
ncbi:MAG: hypothetical protein K0B10_05935 [Vicingaceae bacterium]|nr:hypothetical protein [Vicingaceae bacterium]